jgi:hypothetical protein
MVRTTLALVRSKNLTVGYSVVYTVSLSPFCLLPADILRSVMAHSGRTRSYLEIFFGRGPDHVYYNFINFRF